MESAVDDQPAQDIRGNSHGYSAPKNDPEPPAALLRGLRLRLRHLQPNRSGHRDHNRLHHRGPCGGLDLRHLHGPRVRRVCLRLHQPSLSQRVQAAAAPRGRLASEPVAGGGRRGRGDCCCDDMGYMMRLEIGGRE